MTQPLDPMLAPAEAAADATVSALQGAPPAPMPGAFAAPPPPPAAPGAPAAPAAAPHPGEALIPPSAKAALDSSAASAVEQARKLAAPAAAPGMVQTGEQQVSPATPEQAAQGRTDLSAAQGAGGKAAHSAMQAQAVEQVNDYWLKRGAQQLAEERYLTEKRATDEIQARTMRAYEETADGELDPDRVFTGSPGSGWGLVSTILGAVVGGIALGPVGAVAMAVRGIDRAVRKDLDLQKERKNSRLKQYEQILGDQRLAYQRLYSQQMNIAAQQAETLASESKARGTFAQMNAVADQVRAMHMRENADFNKGLQTKTSRDYTNEVLIKKPGAGPAPLAPETAPVLEAFRRHGVDVKDAGYRDYVSKRVEAAPYMTSVKTAGTTLENVMAKFQGQDVPGYGRVDEKMPVEALGNDARAIRQAFSNAVDEFGRKKSGAAISKDEWEFLQNIARGGGSLAEMRRGIEIMRRRGQSALDEYDRGFPQYRNLQRELDGLERANSPTPFEESDLSLKAPPAAAPTPGLVMVPDDEAKKDAERRKARQTAGGKAVSDILFKDADVDDFLTQD